MRLAGIEPTTPWFVAKYSIQLSYSREKQNYSTGSIRMGSPSATVFVQAIGLVQTLAKRVRQPIDHRVKVPFTDCLVKTMNRFWSYGALLVALATSASAAFSLTLEELRVLDRRCEEARAAALEPIRARLARECEQSRPQSSNPKEECAVELSTYGNNRTGARGNVIPGMFYDLPECKAAQAAWDERDRNPPWR